MTCHLGYTTQHLSIGCIYAAFIGWFIGWCYRSPSASLRIPVLAGSVSGVLYHTLMGAACASPSVSAHLHAYWGTLGRVRMISYCSIVVSLAGMASHCIGVSRFNKARHAFFQTALSVPALACMLFLWQGLRNNDDLEYSRSLCQLANATSLLASWFFIFPLWSSFWSSSSKVLIYSLVFVLPIGATAIRKYHHLDLDGRVVPPSIEDAVDPLWAAPLSALLIDLMICLIHATAAHAITSLSCSQPPPSAPFAYTSFQKASKAVSMWHLVPALLSVIIFGVNQQHADHGFWQHQHVRELLSVGSHQVVSSDSLWLTCLRFISVLVLLVVLVLQGGIRKRQQPFSLSESNAAKIRSSSWLRFLNFSTSNKELEALSARLNPERALSSQSTSVSSSPSDDSDDTAVTANVRMHAQEHAHEHAHEHTHELAKRASTPA